MQMVSDEKYFFLKTTVNFISKYYWQTVFDKYPARYLIAYDGY